MTERASCSECPSSFELVPPADPDYSVPKEKSSNNDNIKRIYECEEEHHRNTIYWHKKEFIFKDIPRHDELRVPTPSGFADY